MFTCEFVENPKVEVKVAEGDDRTSLVYSDRDLDLFWGEEADVPTDPIAGVSCESSAPVACGEREEESRLENEECVLELMATPLSGLCLVFLTFAPAGLAVGDPSPGADGARGLRGLAADAVEGEAMEEGTGGVWGGTCNYWEKINVIAISHTHRHVYSSDHNVYAGKGDYFKLISSKHYSNILSFLHTLYIHAYMHVCMSIHSATQQNVIRATLQYHASSSHIRYKGSD